MSRKATSLVLELVDEGMIDKDYLILACLKWMSEDDVAEMARINELIPDDEEDDDAED